MAKQQNLTKYQQGIVSRYYEHKEGLNLSKLQELVTELYLAESAKAKDKLWERAEAAMKSAQVASPVIAKILAGRDVKLFATELEKILKQRGT